MALTIDAGSPLLIEVEFTKAEPFKGYTLFDPVTADYVVLAPNVIIEPDDYVIVSDNLLMHDLGRWYCIVQTLTSWAAGDYVVRITSMYDTSSDVEVKETAFTLSTTHVV